MPLSRIAEVLELRGSEAAEAIALYGLEVEAGLRTKRKLVSYLESYLEGKGEAMYDVQVREVPAQKVLTIQRQVYVKDLPSFIDSSFDTLYGHIRRSGLQPGPVGFVVYHGEVNKDSDGPVEVCVPFAGSLEPEGEMRVRLEPAHHEAYARITKAQVEFPGILRAYEAVDGWIRAQGREMTQSPHEVYFADWEQIGPDDPACDVAFPIAK